MPGKTQAKILEKLEAGLGFGIQARCGCDPERFQRDIVCTTPKLDAKEYLVSAPNEVDEAPIWCYKFCVIVEGRRRIDPEAVRAGFDEGA